MKPRIDFVNRHEVIDFDAGAVTSASGTPGEAGPYVVVNVDEAAGTVTVRKLTRLEEFWWKCGAPARWLRDWLGRAGFKVG